MYIIFLKVYLVISNNRNGEREYDSFILLLLLMFFIQLILYENFITLDVSNFNYFNSIMHNVVFFKQFMYTFSFSIENHIHLIFSFYKFLYILALT